MYKKMLLLLVFVFSFSFLLSSCRVTRQEIQKNETTTQVTSEKLVTYKDTTVFAPKAETSLQIPISELVFKNHLNTDSKPIIYSQKNGQANVKLKIVHDTIQVTATCDSLAIVAKIKSEFQKHLNSEKSNNYNLNKQKTGFSFWDLLLVFVFGIVIASSIGFILKFIKR